MSYIKTDSRTNFDRFVGGTVRNIPFLAILVILGNYIIMGWATSALLISLLKDIDTGWYIAWGVGIFASLGRGSLVFLPNFDPDRPDFSIRGEVSAVAFTALFLYECFHLVIENGLSPVISISFSILAVMGAVLEILTVGNIKRKHNSSIASDPAKVKAYINSLATSANMEALEDQARAAMRQKGQFFDLSEFSGHFDTLPQANKEKPAQPREMGNTLNFDGLHLDLENGVSFPFGVNGNGAS